MAFLFDTNGFLRLADRNDDLREPVLSAIQLLRSRNEELCYTSQIISEFWNVCTRPQTARSGFGLSVEQTERKILIIEKHFRLLPDSLGTFDEWRRLVKDMSIIGVQVHDAKIVASMMAYSVSHLLTLNPRDFKRFNFISVIDPRDLR